MSNEISKGDILGLAEELSKVTAAKYNDRVTIGACVNVMRGLAEIQRNAEDANRVERMDGALQQIKDWSQAYPLTAFPEPDMAKAHKVLTAAGMTLDAISASSMRHVITRVQAIVDAAMQANNAESSNG